MNPTDEITRINQTEVPASPRAAHTPGPWYLNPRGWVVQSTGDIVTRLECSYNKEADARLIAAAPELLAALENQVNCWEAMLEHALRLEDSGMAYSCRNAIHHARAAIAKAKGGAL